MRLEIAARTDVGTERERNEDALVIGAERIAAAPAGRLAYACGLDAPLFVGVADGIGGHAAGALASTIATERLACARLHGKDDLEAQLRAIDAELLEKGRDAETFALGTTFCGLLFGSDILACSIGDGIIAMRTGRALRPIGPTWEDVATTTLLESALGGGRAAETPLRIGWYAVQKFERARYVIATDGVVRAIPYEVFSAAVSDGHSPEDCLDRIFTRALAKRAPDNLTCIVVEISSTL